MKQKKFSLIRIFFMLGALVFLIADIFSVGNSLQLLPFIALIASGTVGLAHGGLDWQLAKHFGLRTSARESSYFILAYLLCILVTLIVWQFIPSLALIIFILMSAVHFAGDWRQELSPITTYFLGVTVICLPTLNFYNEVKSIFELLLSGPNATLFTVVMYYSAIASCLLVGLNLAYLVWLGKHSWIILEVFVLILLGILLTPIVYFSIYFCFLHAPKHWATMRQIGLYPSISQGLRSALWPTIFCIAIGMVVFYYLVQLINFNDALCKTVFIGLAVLTVPHWVLVESCAAGKCKAQ